MKIELKNIKHSAFASQETHCYQATVYVDGKKIGTVENSGHGGADSFHGDYAAFAAAEAWLKANMPGETFEVRPGETMTIDMSMEIFCGEEVNKFLTMRDMKRTLKSNVLLREGKDLFTVKVKVGTVEAAIERVRAKYPSAVILNGMPDEQALAVYRGK